MYEVKLTGEKIDSFFGAVKIAQAIGSEVYEVATGNRRWAPAAKVTAKQLRQYREGLSAYAASKK